MSNSKVIKKERLESQIKEIINETISREIYDDLIKMATIVDVRLTNDKSIATIYISCYDKNIEDKVLKKVIGATGFFKKALSQELTLRKIPNLIFKIDTSYQNYETIENILKELKEKKDEQQ